MGMVLICNCSGSRSRSVFSGLFDVQGSGSRSSGLASPSTPKRLCVFRDSEARLRVMFAHRGNKQHTGPVEVKSLLGLEIEVTQREEDAGC